MTELTEELKTNIIFAREYLKTVAIGPKQVNERGNVGACSEVVTGAWA